MNEMKHWPEYTTPNEKPYTLRHVGLLEETLGFCKRLGTAIQAGGSIGYWPRRMADKFKRVITFEPEPMIRECLIKNLIDYPNVEVRAEALGYTIKRCSLERRGFGSHKIISGDDINIITIDSLCLETLDLLQLDIEGYELYALYGGRETIIRCKPIIQVEALEAGALMMIRDFLDTQGYQLIKTMGRDYVFSH